MGVTNLSDLEADSVTCDSLECGDATIDVLSLTTPLVKANANESLKRSQVNHEFQGTLADGSTNVRNSVMMRSGRVTAIYLACGTKMVGGTNTLALARVRAGVSTNLLSTTNVDPAVVPAAANAGEAMTLNTTAANLTFQAGDILRSTLVCGTMTTDGAQYMIGFDVEYDDV